MLLWSQLWFGKLFWNGLVCSDYAEETLRQAHYQRKPSPLRQSEESIAVSPPFSASTYPGHILPKSPLVPASLTTFSMAVSQA